MAARIGPAYRSGSLPLSATDRYDVIRRCAADPHPSMGIVTAPAHSTVTTFRPCPELRGDLGLVTTSIAPDSDDLMTVCSGGGVHATQHGQH